MSSDFFSVKCNCGNELVVFSKSSSKVDCSSCNETILEPTGGNAVIHGKIIKKLD